MRLRRSTYLILIVLVTLTAGCVTRVNPNAMQPHAEVDTSPIYGSHTVGQTFVVNRRNLSGIELRWAHPEEVRGPIIVHLSPAPGERDLVRVKVDPADGKGQTRFSVHFPPLRNSQGRRYYVSVEAPHATAQQPLSLRAVPRDVYAPGTAYENGEPWSGDLTFQTFYAYDASFLREDLGTAWRWAWLLLPGLALFWAPGALLLRLWPEAEGDFDLGERTAMAFGLSLAFVAFSLLWITQLGGRLNATTARLLYGLLGAVALFVAGRRAWRRREGIWEGITHPDAHRVRLLLLGIVLTLGLVGRLLAIRDLAFPAWVDSVHHATVAQIILERGRVPATYLPYVDVDRATYHFGFHAAVASFAWLSGLPVERAMLLVGQFFNITMALQVYLLARWLTQRRWTAFFATFFVALLSTMPAYYVSWGRYTQLGGLLLLPVAVVCTVEAVEARDWRGMVLALFSQAGLILVHYRVLAFYVCFVGAWWLVKSIETPSAWRDRLREVGYYAALGVGAAVTLLPWLAETAVHLWLRAWVHWGGDGGAGSALWDFSLSFAGRGFDRYLLTVGGLGVILGLWERRRFSGVLLLWLGALFLVTNPSVVGLPGEGLTNNIAMLITWFIPQAIWSGFILDEVFRAWQTSLGRRGRVAFRGIAVLLLAGLGTLGFHRQVTILSPTGVVAVDADRAALRWLETHTPQGSHFLINARVWQGPFYRGTDGGYWITPLTGRITTTPPALYHLGGEERVEEVRRLNEDVEELVSSPSALARRLRASGVDYVYVGALGGILEPEMLDGAAEFKRVYVDAYARIYEVGVPSP
jgi:hypothetical protein